MSKTQVEVITSVQRRRRWAISEKERIVAAALEPGAVASEVARAAGISDGGSSSEALSVPRRGSRRWRLSLSQARDRPRRGLRKRLRLSSAVACGCGSLERAMLRS